MHNLVGPCHFPDHAEGARTILAKLGEDWLPKQVSTKEHAVADLFLVEVLGQCGVIEWRTCTHAQHEAEPGGIRSAPRTTPCESVCEFERGPGSAGGGAAWSLIRRDPAPGVSG